VRLFPPQLEAYNRGVTRIFDAAWREKATLSDGRKVELRLLRPDDASLLAVGFEKLSDQSRFRRFHGPRPQLSADDLKYLTQIDGENHFALVALEAATGEGLGVARFVRLPKEPRVAEPAAVVIDEIQGTGLGRLLLFRLGAAARERGIDWFRCAILANNEPLRDMVNRLVPDVVQKLDGDVLRFDIPLAQLEGAAPAIERDHPFHPLLVATATGALLLAHTAEYVRHWISDRASGQQPDDPRKK
jgi:GNAT superfamily N-acetyltransferase